MDLAVKESVNLPAKICLFMPYNGIFGAAGLEMRQAGKPNIIRISGLLFMGG
jgi:hypothetical protein